MLPRVLRFAPLLLSATLGAGLWAVTHQEEKHGAALSGTREVSYAARREFVRETVRERLKEAPQAREPSYIEEPRSLTPRERGSERRAARKEQLAGFGEDLLKLRSLAEKLRNVPDLKSEVSRNLEDSAPDMRTLAAIFLEWHRRNPVEAFDEMAKFPDVLEWVIESGVTRILPAEEVAAQLKHPERSSTFGDNMLLHHARLLAMSDSLRDLQDLFLKIDSGQQRLLVSGFRDYWQPADAAEAVGFLMVEADPQLRRGILENLASEDNDGEVWSEEFSSALMSRDLGDFEKLRPALLASISASTEVTPPRESSLGIPQPDLGEILEDALVEERDYPELLRRGEIDASTLHSRILVRVPGAESEQEAFVIALFKAIAPHHPEAALEWAASKLPKDKFLRASTEVILRSEDPRCSRLAFLMEHLPMDPSTDFGEIGLDERFKDWLRSAPAEAEDALSRLPADSVLKAVVPSGATREER
ncbi:hypothetical protein [Luteolibacter luteus]|uniref:Uncharacterized protein n=1 Tax=Luteolibacter luteus TaxID=2728835 RepID=A0A858RJG3_9BACT|nr:hypothetical protein [Luteolibacter luteus]QJE96193.1 hypothetical protein HHL09_10480 [Luteolibacter luteus]